MKQQSKLDKDFVAQAAKMDQIRKDLRIITQITQRLVSHHDEQLVLHLDQEVDIEVVQDHPMIFTLSLQGLPTPVRLRIKYTDKDLTIKETHLTVTCQFHPFDERRGDKTDATAVTRCQLWSKSYVTPTTIVVHSQGHKAQEVQRLLPRRPDALAD